MINHHLDLNITQYKPRILIGIRYEVVNPVRVDVIHQWSERKLDYYGYINPNHATEISEFIGRTINMLHRVDSRIPQRMNLKMLPMSNAG